MALNNNQVAAVINAAIAMSTGAEAVDTLDLSAIVDNGNDANVIGEKETFTKAMIAVLTKNWFTDSAYRTQYSDPFFEDTERFGAIIQAISVEVPQVKQSHAWKDFSPKQGNPATAGVYELYLPVVNTQYYGKSISWELPICITNTQWDTAFESESDLRGLVEYVLMCVDNAIVQHLENMNNANRNAFMAEKIAYQNSDDAVGVHVVNLVEAYQKSLETQSDMTAEAFLNSEDGLRFAAEEMQKKIGFLQKMSTLHNTAGRQRFIPKDRLVVQILDSFKLRAERVALTDAFNTVFASLPLAETVPYWQGLGEGETFDEVSSINVKTASNDTVTKSGIVGFFADKWACLHTVRDRRTAAVNFDPEDLVQYYMQFRDQYMNDLTMNAIVFTVEDYTAPVVGA